MCHMGSQSVTCHPAEVTFPPLPRPIKAGTRFSYSTGMQDWVELVGWLYTEVVRPKTVTHPSTNRARRRVTSLKRRTTLHSAKPPSDVYVCLSVCYSVLTLICLILLACWSDIRRSWPINFIVLAIFVSQTRYIYIFVRWWQMVKCGPCGNAGLQFRVSS